MFETTLSQVSDETREFVRQHLDKLDAIDIIDTAYSLYMPQIRAEIEELYSFVENHCGFTSKSTPYNILEIGTKFGGTFYLWNSINRSGLNISIDLEAGIHGGISEEEMDKRDLWFNERFDNCRFIRGDSHDPSTLMQAIRLLASIPPNNVNINMLFIDGDHTYEGVKQDFQMFSPFVSSGGLVIFHDIIISDHHHSRNVYVGEFWNEIKNDPRFESFEIIGSPDQNWAGLGVLRKK